jgi:hypothetical protein
VKQLIGSLFLILMAVGCSSSSSRSNYYKESESDRPSVDDKYRLTADRQQFDEMRSQERGDQKVKNDEVAFVMQLMADPSQDPSRIREKFDRALSKKRDLYHRDSEKERDGFNKTESKSREDFLKALDTERKEYLTAKHSHDERDDFFSHQDEKRKNYFENQHEKRNDFESDMTERRKNFEDYAREKQNEFSQELRAFQKRHDEYEKAAASSGVKASPASPSTKAADPEVKSFLQEFMNIPSTPATSLESGE